MNEQELRRRLERLECADAGCTRLHIIKGMQIDWLAEQLQLATGWATVPIPDFEGHPDILELDELAWPPRPQAPAGEPEGTIWGTPTPALPSDEPTPQSVRLLTLSEAADLLRVSYTTVKRLRREHSLGYRVGRRWMIPNDELTAWLRSREEGASA